MIRSAVFLATGFLLAFFAPPGQAFEACADLLPGGTAPHQTSTTLVDLCKRAEDQDAFVIRFDTVRKIPQWAAHKLTPKQLAQIRTAPAFPTRTDFFSTDTAVPITAQAQINTYRNTGYDKGHLVRAQDMNWSAAAYRTSFLMTNMTPQRGALNSGPWLGMEKAFQELVESKQRSLWAIAGAYGTNAITPTLKDQPGNAAVPNCFYKIMVSEDDTPDGGKRYKTLSAVFINDDHDRKQKTWTTYVTTLDIVKARSGIDFFQNLNVETNHDAAFWGVNMPNTPADCL